MNAPRVLVTDGEQRGALAACRGLAAAGYEVSALAPARCSAALWSVTCSERFVGPDATRDPEGFVDRLAGILRRGRYDTVLPCSDASLVAISDGRDALDQWTRLGLPSREVVNRSLDKDVLHREAANVGLLAPRSVLCASSAEVGSAVEAIGFPLVLKPRRTLRLAEDSRHQQPVLVASDLSELREHLRVVDLPLILQELLAQAERRSFGGVMTDEGLAGYAVARFERTWPPPAGSFSFGETIAPPPDLPAIATELAQRLGWRGIFELEFLESADGQRHAIDFNPRVYGCMTLVTAAGANLAALWCGALLGRRPAMSIGRAGVRYRWEEADAAHLAWQLRRGHVRAAAAVARPHRSVVHAQFRLRDPGPLLARAIGLAAARAT